MRSPMPKKTNSSRHRGAASLDRYWKEITVYMARSKFDYNYSRRRRRRKRHNWLFEILVAVFAIILLICAYAGKINPSSFFAAPFLTLAYMPMLLLVPVVLLVSALCRRWIAVLTVILAFVATLPVFRLYVPLNNVEELPPVPADTTLLLKVMTYNVLSFNYNEPQEGITPSSTMKLILDANPDVVLIQEGNPNGLSWSEIPSIQPYINQVNARYPYCYSGVEGLNIMSKYPFTTQSIGSERHARSVLGFNRNQSAYVARAFDLRLPSGKQIRLVDFRFQSYHLSFGKNQNVRVSPDAKPAPLERMRRSFSLRNDDALTLRHAIDASPANVIVCGDMNDVPSSHVYRVVRGDDMNDAWCDVGQGYAYTFNRYNLPYRIDHVLYRGDLVAVGAERVVGGSSDHYPLMVTFDIDFSKNKTKKTNNNH